MKDLNCDFVLCTPKYRNEKIAISIFNLRYKIAPILNKTKKPILYSDTNVYFFINVN